jgi:hypothetical protein
MKRKKQPIKVDVVASTETIDLRTWLDGYALAIVEAKRTGTLATTEAA